MLFYSFFFFFKQKTAYEMLRSLVGSEMCIRDRYITTPAQYTIVRQFGKIVSIVDEPGLRIKTPIIPVSYTHLTLPTIYSV